MMRQLRDVSCLWVEAEWAGGITVAKGVVDGHIPRHV